MKILAVDDSPLMREVIRKAVELLGYEFFEAANGQEALNLLKEQAIDIVTMDWNMPILDGYETVQVIRNNPTFAHLKILMLSSRDGEMYREKALNAGANHYMSKPFRQESLMEQLMSLERKAS
jgi:two-component system, chemotaxis family, chemotaxis protein CheY